jgi:hypothetical protein
VPIVVADPSSAAAQALVRISERVVERLAEVGAPAS